MCISSLVRTTKSHHLVCKDHGCLFDSCMCEGLVILDHSDLVSGQILMASWSIAHISSSVGNSQFSLFLPEENGS